jgi:hypothetical protein
VTVCGENSCLDCLLKHILLGTDMWNGLTDRQNGAALNVGLWGDLLSVQFTVAQWTRYLHLVWCSGQRGRTVGR